MLRMSMTWPVGSEALRDCVIVYIMVAGVAGVAYSAHGIFTQQDPN